MPFCIMFANHVGISLCTRITLFGIQLRRIHTHTRILIADTQNAFISNCFWAVSICTASGNLTHTMLCVALHSSEPLACGNAMQTMLRDAQASGCVSGLAILGKPVFRGNRDFSKINHALVSINLRNETSRLFCWKTVEHEWFFVRSIETQIHIVFSI